MAKLFLESTDATYTVSTGKTEVHGANSDQVVTVASGVTGVTFDANVEGVNFAGATGDYQYQIINRSSLGVYKGTDLVATVAIQDDVATASAAAVGTVLSFSNGTVAAQLTTSNGTLTGLTLGGTVVTTSQTTVAPTTWLSQNGGTSNSAAVQTKILTSGVDGVNSGTNFTTGSGDDIFVAGTTGHWGALDVIDGGDGNDAFTVAESAAIASVPSLSKVLNIETLNIFDTVVVAGNGVTLNTASDATNFTKLAALNVTTTGAGATQTLTAAATTDVTATSAAGVAIYGGKAVTASGVGAITIGGSVATNPAGAVKVTNTAQGATAITVDGGTTQNITAAGAIAGSTIVVGNVTSATGDVVVNSTTSSVDTTVQGTILVKGGTTVTVNQYSANAVATTTTGGAVTVTGTAATTAVTVTDVPAATQGAAVVGRVNGGVTINDVNAASLTAAGTITNVTLGSFGNVGGAVSTINSGALTTINLSGTATGAGLTVTNGSLTTPLVTTQALNLNGFSTDAGAGVITLDSDITTLNIASTTAASTIKSLVAAGATTVNVTGNANLTLTGNTFTAATAITVSNTGATSFGTAIPTGATFTGSAGAETIALTTNFTKAIATGAGNDTVTYAAQGTGGSVNAGDGNDTIVMTGAEANAADANSTFNTKFTGFETLSLSTALDSAGNTTLNLAGLNNVTKVSTVGVGTDNMTLTLSNFSSNGTLKITSDTSATTSGGISVDIANAVFSSADVLNVELSKSSALLAAGSITAAGVETVNFNVADAASAGSAAVIHTAALVATSATSVVVTGNNGFNLTNTGNTAITNFDASGVVANSTATAVDTEANLKVTFLSANTTGPTTIKGGAGGDSLTAVAGTDSIDGGAGNDSIDGGAGNDILIGGAGSDLITGGLGVDTLTGGTGVDTFVVVAQATTGVDSITDFVGGVDVLKTGITPTTAALTNLSASAYAGSSLAAQAGLAITAAITAAATNYDSAGDAVLFTYGTDTYVVVNDAGNSTFTDGTDLVVKLTGLSGTLVIGNIIA